MKTIYSVASAMLLAAITACGSSYGGGNVTGVGGSTGSEPLTVNAGTNLTFGPSTLTAKPGDVVTFAFGSVAHNVFFDAVTGAPADIPGDNANTSVQRTFPTAGTFHYVCHIHPFMTGTVVVTAAGMSVQGVATDQ